MQGPSCRGGVAAIIAIEAPASDQHVDFGLAQFGTGTMTKVGKSDGEATFAGTHGNDGGAPKAGIQVSVLFVRADHLFRSRPDRAS
jgi:hypothetical protein